MRSIAARSRRSSRRIHVAAANRPGVQPTLPARRPPRRGAFISIGLMSGMSNILMLTGAIFMLEIYDRVLPSRSVPTLIGLVILAAGLYCAQGFLDLLRGRILGRIGTSLENAITARVFAPVFRLPLMVGSRNEGLQP